jgi:hypothetical protein
MVISWEWVVLEVMYLTAAHGAQVLMVDLL